MDGWINSQIDGLRIHSIWLILLDHGSLFCETVDVAFVVLSWAIRLCAEVLL